MASSLHGSIIGSTSSETEKEKLPPQLVLGNAEIMHMAVVKNSLFFFVFLFLLVNYLQPVSHIYINHKALVFVTFKPSNFDTILIFGLCTCSVVS